jgi:hypothetical protein
VKSLSELQSSPDVGLPETHADVCVSAKLVDELSAIDAELFEVEAQVEQLRETAAREAEGEPQGPPKRPGDASRLPELEEKAAELAAKADAVRDRMADTNVRLQLRGKELGEWRQWAVRHPARDAEADPQGYERDVKWAGGHVNIDALAGDLGQFVVRYNDEEPSEAWAKFVTANGAPAHLVVAASKVVGLHEQVVDQGKSRSAWLAARRSANTSD